MIHGSADGIINLFNINSMKRRLELLAILMTMWSLLPVWASAANDETITGAVVNLTLTEPNTLRETLVDKEYTAIGSFTLHGPVGSDDLKCIVEGTWFTDVQVVDLSDITIVPDEGLYATTQVNSNQHLRRQNHYLSARDEIKETSGTNGLGVGYTITDIYATDLGGLFAEKQSLRELKMPNYVKSVGYGLCYRCFNLTTVSFPQGVTKVKLGAFESCTQLKNHNFGQLTEIEDYAFEYVPITTLDLSKCTSIGVSTFYQSGLTEANLSSATSVSLSTSYNSGAFQGCTSLKKVTFSDKLMSIGGYAFDGCSVLTAVAGLPKALEDINGTSFKDTPWFNNLPYNSDVKYINNVAMCASATATSLNFRSGTTRVADNFMCENRDKVTSLSLPSSLRYIGNEALKDLSITTLTIPENVEYMGYSALRGNNKVTKINYNAISANANVDDYYLYAIVGSACTKVVIGKKVQRIPYGFNGQNLTIVDFEERDASAPCVSISNKAFQGCENLKRFNGFQYVDSIGKYAFYKAGFASLNIPANVKYVGEKAFQYCPNLSTVYYGAPVVAEYLFNDSDIKEITLGSAVRKIGRHAFEYCDKLTNVKFDNRTAQTDSLSIGYSAFSDCTSLESFDGWEYVDSIGSAAFHNVGLTSVILSKGLRYVGDILKTPFEFYPIYGNNIKTIYYDCPLDIYRRLIAYETENLTVGKHATKVDLYNFPRLTTLIMEDRDGNAGLEICDGNSSDKSITDVQGWENVASIGEYAFSYCGLKTVSLPSSINKIGDAAFLGNKSLTSVYYDVPIAGGANIFAYSGTTEVTFGKNIRSIPEKIFCGNTGLKNIVFEVIPMKYFSINPEAFSYCSGLDGQDISLPAGTRAVGCGVFRGVKLNSISVPESIWCWDDEYPADDTSIDHAYIYAPTPSSDWLIKSTNTIYVLPQSLEAYKQDSRWGTIENILPMDDAHLPTAIKAVYSDIQDGTDGQNATYYNMEGQRVSSPKGFTIVRNADGTTRKVMKK